MSKNLKSYVVERQRMSAGDVLDNLSRQVTGRSIGEFFVTESSLTNEKELLLELDDGCKFVFSCRRIK
jgi:hypothetical protein